MTWRYNEVVRSGNSTARLKNYYTETGMVILFDIQGEFEAGMTIVGDDSNESLTLTEYNFGIEYDIGYDPDPWTAIEPIAVTLDNGSWVTLDAHFDGKPSQDYQPDNAVTLG